MKRVLLHVAVVMAVASLCAGAAGARTPPRSVLTGFHCQRALDPMNRSVSARAVMRPLPGTRSLSLRIDLVERAAGVTRSLTGAGDLGIWLTPKDPTLGQRAGDVWQLTKSVSNLEAPASYRFRVTFRWLGARGRVLGTVTERSASCVQRELRPDLAVRDVSVAAIPNQPLRERYTAQIANAGASAAGPFQVLFTPGDGSPPQSRTVDGLGAHSSLRLTLVGPVCNASSPPTIVVDSTDQVDDGNRNNNAMAVTCPA